MTDDLTKTDQARFGDLKQTAAVALIAAFAFSLLAGMSLGADNYVAGAGAIVGVAVFLYLALRAWIPLVRPTVHGTNGGKALPGDEAPTEEVRFDDPPDPLAAAASDDHLVDLP